MFIFVLRWTDEARRERCGSPWLLAAFPYLCARVCVSAISFELEICSCDPGNSVGPSSEVSGSFPERTDLYVKMGASLPPTSTETQLQHLPHRQHRAESWTLPQSAPPRCASADKGSVKYYNKQNRKVVLACQRLPFFSRVRRPLTRMEKFPLKQKTRFSPPA